MDNQNILFGAFTKLKNLIYYYYYYYYYLSPPPLPAIEK